MTTSLHLFCSCGQRFRAICSDATASRIQAEWQKQHAGPEHKAIDADEFDRLSRKNRNKQPQPTAALTNERTQL